MLAANLTLWILGVFLFLWGVTLAVRGAPDGVFRQMRRWFRGEELGGRRGDARLAVGGLAAMMAGGAAIVMGVAVYDWAQGKTSGGFSFSMWAGAALTLAALGVGVLVWAVRGERALGRRCPQCSYSMEGGGVLCPECGFAAAEERDFFRPRRRRRVAALALVVLVLSPSVMLVQRYQQWGGLGLVPSTVMIAGFERLPEGWIQWNWPTNGSLMNRLQDGKLAKWQERWLMRRTTRLMVSDRSSPEAVVRAAAFTGHKVPPEWEAQYIARLIELICDPSQEVRDKIAAGLYIPWALGQASRDHADLVEPHVERLRARLQDPTPDVAMAAAALLVAGSVHVEEAIEVAVRHTLAGTLRSRAASEVVQFALHRPAARDTALAMFRHEDPVVRRLVISAGRWGRGLDAEFEAEVMRMLEDSEIDVAYVAAQSLHYSGIPGVVEKIVRAAAPRETIERTHLLTVLVKTMTDGVLIAELVRSDDARVRVAAVELMGMRLANHYDPLAVEALYEAAASAEPEIAEAAATILEALQVEGERGGDP